MLRNVCSSPPRWSHPEVWEDPAQLSIPFCQHPGIPGQWTLGLLLQWRWCSVEHHRRCKLIRQKAFREDRDWCWRGELQIGNQVCPHQGIYPGKKKMYEVIGFNETTYPRTFWAWIGCSHAQLSTELIWNLKNTLVLADKLTDWGLQWQRFELLLCHCLLQLVVSNNSSVLLSWRWTLDKTHFAH